METIQAWAALEQGQALRPYSYEPGPLGPEDVEIAVDYCGICYSDIALIDNEWLPPTRYPLVPGHEVVGRVTAAGAQAKGVREGDRVGLGWYAGSCGTCRRCLRGENNMCAKRQPTIVGRHGGFAQRVRAQWPWCMKLPETMESRRSGPLLCAGVTVFSPLYMHGVKPTHRVGVVGIGGLGHLALQFARAWGCEVTALTTSPAKFDEARALGAHKVVLTSDTQAMAALAGTFDFLLVSARGFAGWDQLIDTIAPGGRLHQVGVVTEQIPVRVRPFLMAWQRSISGSSTGSTSSVAEMLDFAARHDIVPRIEQFAMRDVNAALDRVRSGEARYRVVLASDF
ncbi:MAG: NAD(P)-dependent alcohol dehydrogenase [Pseudomonadota bacterium]